MQHLPLANDSYIIVAQLTVGASGILRGYATSLGTFGSLLPSAVCQWAPQFGSRPTVDQCYTSSSSPAFDLIMKISSGGLGSLPQNFFNRILIQDGAGVVRTYTSASATYVGSGDSLWEWGTGSNPVYTAGDTGKVRSFIMLR